MTTDILNKAALLESDGKIIEAIALYSQLIANDPKNEAAIIARAKARNTRLLYQEAIEDYTLLVQNRPSRNHYYMLAVGYYRLGQIDRSDILMSIAKKGAVYDELPLNIRFFDALLDLKMGRIKSGFQKYQVRQQLKPIQLDARLNSVPDWQGEALEGRSILVMDEQGFGDLFQFARFLSPLLSSGAQVTFLTRAPVVSLLRSSFPDLILITELEDQAGFDFKVMLLDCALFCFEKEAEDPFDLLHPRARYLQPSQKHREKWAHYLETYSGVRVGICWQGSSDNFRNALRSLPSSFVRQLLATEDVTWVSLQQDVTMTAADHLIQRDLPFEDFDDTAALITSLDLVITVETSIAHLAAALGCPTWVLLDKGCDWRWQNDSEACWWYETVTIYQQDKFKEWGPIIDICERDLLNKAASYLSY